MLRRKMLVFAFAGLAAIASRAYAAEIGAPETRPPDTSIQLPAGTTLKPLVVARSCASECQAQHDRCRVETKGSRTCDEARQRCLQVCLQKKRK